MKTSWRCIIERYILCLKNQVSCASVEFHVTDTSKKSQGVKFQQHKLRVTLHVVCAAENT